MRKIFLPLFFCLTMIFSSASAQDVFATSKDGYDYYVMTETVTNEDFTVESNGKKFNGGAMTGKVKKILDGKLIATQDWKFSAIAGHACTYFIDGVRSGSLNSKHSSFWAYKIYVVISSCVRK